MKPEKITGVILAGGKSSRMKTNKAFVTINNKMLIKYIIEVFKKRNYEIIISGNKSTYEFLGYTVIEDNYKEIGPIAGIESALSYSKNKYIIFSSCDTPFIDEQMLIEMEKKAHGYDIVVPTVNNFIQPMNGLYNKALHNRIVKFIKSGKSSPRDFIKTCNYKPIPIKNKESLLNINTPEELRKIQKSKKGKKLN